MRKVQHRSILSSHIPVDLIHPMYYPHLVRSIVDDEGTSYFSNDSIAELLANKYHMRQISLQNLEKNLNKRYENIDHDYKDPIGEI